MTELWFVEDFMSGNVLENKYYSTKAEAVAARERLCYGIIKSYRFQDGGRITMRDGSTLVALTT
jgi:hypothetical protein